MQQGEEIKQLIPQREPIMMIDTFYGATETTGKSGLTVLADNVFCEDGQLREMGVIEHIAQTCAAYNGVKNKKNNGVESKPKLGYIGEIKKCQIARLPRIGEQLVTEVEATAQVMNVTLMEATTKIGSETIASCQIKLFEED
ncbi:MAG: hydroxymyristoyl-ACP dehydratase [Paludibacteraceae bacterium]|jgi:predicted hotdog family 3-hydroxylacyl-ACP dehydratase|nr:hydroxymyristoyl-ACP dehydratase [Paludibacteraceae bacterium]MBP3717824.1 hydroxymyristoyl-ACP dehydratase [Paludibacteraceae bacterium]MBR6106321.1 hydroxymyristoyl-ACP dehydratase [Paludibacteraceae bacterium]